MREALLVAKREYLERVRSKAFRISTVLDPAGICLRLWHGRFLWKDGHRTQEYRSRVE